MKSKEGRLEGLPGTHGEGRGFVDAPKLLMV